MTKATGLAANLYVGGYNVSGSTASLSDIGGGPKPIVQTDITQSAQARAGGVRDGRINAVAYFNADTDAGHDAFSPLPRTDVLVSYHHAAATAGNPAVALVAKQVGYDLTRGADGSLTLAVNALANRYGLEWGVQATSGVRTDTAGSNGTSIDLTTVSTEFGWQAYVHVFALTGTNVVVTLQDSANDSAFTNLSGGAFTSITSAHQWQRLEGGRTDTVRRYLRAVSSGTFTSASFAVVFVRNDTAVTF